MHVAGMDAHATYVVVAIVSNDGAPVRQPVRISNGRSDRLLEVLESYRPLEVVVEASPAWPWLYDLLEGPGYRFMLAHPKKLRAIAESSFLALLDGPPRPCPSSALTVSKRSVVRSSTARRRGCPKGLSDREPPHRHPKQQE